MMAPARISVEEHAAAQDHGKVGAIGMDQHHRLGQEIGQRAVEGGADLRGFGAGLEHPGRAAHDQGGR
jgi:hypothetical protein